MPAAFELFHVIADPGSARVRRYVADHELVDAVRFRNVGFDEHLEKLKARGGDGAVPALWDGAALHVGAEAVIARLAAHHDVGRAG
ncbi:MAG: hypothetical protein K1X89_16275 [Myxococcaceae bacterium]|nr:hypothetical protein [Myxococcaceae bacterium]